MDKLKTLIICWFTIRLIFSDKKIKLIKKDLKTPDIPKLTIPFISSFTAIFTFPVSESALLASYPIIQLTTFAAKFFLSDHGTGSKYKIG